MVNGFANSWLDLVCALVAHQTRLFAIEKIVILSSSPCLTRMCRNSGESSCPSAGRNGQLQAGELEGVHTRTWRVQRDVLED